MTIKGIDVSSYQSTDYGTAGLGFVIVKATEGASYVNPLHGGQVAHGRAAQLVVGHYHFVRPGSMAAQVDYFLAHAVPRAGDPLVLDWEDRGVSDDQKDAWIKTLQAKVPANRVLLYCNRDFWLTRDRTSFCGDGLWIADPDAPAGQPRVKHPWLLHQYSEASGLDRDVAAFTDVAAMRAWATKASPSPAPHHPAPVVHLAHIAAAARRDSTAPQGHTTYKAEVLHVELALVAERLLDKRWADGSFGTKTRDAYATWQRSRSGGHYSGDAADGIPGHDSMTRLGKRHGFTVVA